MIPLTLKIKGLYSYIKETEIDFTQLTSANLFGIFGSTGSGKSTILEAIAFALYGETERLNKNDKRGYNMMNLKSNELLIDFTFQSPTSPQFSVDEPQTTIHRFTVHAKRNSKNFDDIRKFERKAYRQRPDKTWEPIEATSAEEILGLSYENFRRTIIIPQGKFQEFLALGDKDRTKMLKEIFNLQKYELYYQTADLERANNEKIENLKGQLQNIGEIDPEQIKSKKSEHADLTKKIHTTKENLEKLEKSERQFKELVDKKSQTEVQIKTLTKSISENKTILKKTSDSLATTEKTWKETQEKYQNRHTISDKIKDLKNLSQILTNEAEIATLQPRIKKGTDLISQIESQSQQLLAKRKSLRTKESQLRKSLPDLAKLHELQSWFFQTAKLESDLKSLDLPENPTQAISNFQIEKKFLEAEISKLQIQAAISKFATELKPGEPCILCGSKEHPAPTPSNASNTSAIQELKKNLADLDSKILSLSTKLEQHTRLTKDLQDHQSKFPSQTHKTTDQKLIENELQKAAELESDLKKLTHQLESLESQLTQKDTELKKYQSAIQRLQTQLTSLQSQNQTLKSQLTTQTPSPVDNLPTTSAPPPTPESLQSQINALTQELAHLEQTYKTLETERRTLESTLAATEATITTEQKSLAAHQFTLAATATQLTELKYNPESYQLLLSQISETKNTLTTLNQTLGALTQELTHLEKSATDHARLTTSLTALENRAASLTTLKQLFKASGFVNYVSTVHLQNLCDAANERFKKLTRQSLQLELTDDNNFQVRDFLHSGKTRSVKTLSGGQMFQASLCLALALADSVQKLNQSNQNFFFLDEGFGTLDAESLTTVFETLKSLRQERKIVGIISHVEELKQDIDVHLSIRKDSEKGSLVTQSF